VGQVRDGWCKPKTPVAKPEYALVSNLASLETALTGKVSTLNSLLTNLQSTVTTLPTLEQVIMQVDRDYATKADLSSYLSSTQTVSSLVLAI
jgi:hypothetical protein